MEQKPQLRRYTHLPEDEDIGPLERFYQAREARLEYKGREVLYVVSEATGFTCCDGISSPRIETVNIIGYITRWKYTTNDRGMVVSEIEPIEDEETKQEIKNTLQKPLVSKVNFEGR